MWKRPWGLVEGSLICVGLVVVGLILQLCIGNINWSEFAMPLNIAILAIYVFILVALYALRQRIYFIRWAMSFYAAIPSFVAVVVMTLLMGLIRQVPATVDNGDVLGFSKMLSCWPFVLVYWWAATILGLVSIRSICNFRLKQIPFLCNHLGLFIVLVCGVLGSADMSRITMRAQVGQAEWRAADEKGNVRELPLAIELKDFVLEEYPPKLMIINNTTGESMSGDNPNQMLVEDIVAVGELDGWKIEVLEVLDMAASMVESDTIKFVEWHSVGATSAVAVQATSPDGSVVRKGWVSCGSFAFPYQSLKLNDEVSLVMLSREPKRFASNVRMYGQSGVQMDTTIEVNKPVEIEGWKVYQYSYDEYKGRWSDVSVFELVADPWLPYVYVGIFMMLLGALFMFIFSDKSVRRAEK